MAASSLLRAGLALISLVVVAGCSTGSNTQYVSSAPAVTGPNVPLPGARPPGETPVGPASGAETYNSDNRLLATRSGLNSDPRNPSGAPGHPYDWTSP
jgi:hypothetical protein